ncbi:CMRF35-like molecule 3 isoform X2 [Carassius gibelio]|uniref:CMRF35-like molecule 3 isoform X2 n=1 Tax=Carassius gibelio TaxID=101364 RepID=UPI0022778A4E|nr:CMRF35-like molecule 3 isoform X2 [Carassius gibelio]
MWSFLLLWFCMGIVVVGARVTVLGFRGKTADIRCPYESGYESNPKYLCKGECKIINKVIMVKSGSPAKDQRFSLSDNRTARVFTVTITDLRLEDEGQYWCGVERTVFKDVYSEILLLVKQDIGTTEGPTVRLCLMTSTRVSSAPLTPQTLQAQTSPPDSGSFDIIIIVITAGALVLFFICAVLLIVAIRKTKTCGLVSFSAQGLHLTFRKEEDNTYETETPAVVSNSHTAQSDEAFDTDLDVMTAAAAVRNSVNPDQIYTQLNPSRHSHIYQSLTAGSQEESIYHTIHQPLD